MASSYTLSDHFEGPILETELAALRLDIAEGLSSGESEEHDMYAVLAEAKSQRQATK